MKKLLITIFTFAALAANAQQNILMDQSFWQGAPNVEAVKAELAKGASPTQGTMFSDPILMAINAQAPNETIKFLLDQPGVDVNKSLHDDRRYLHWAASRGNEVIMEYLISKGAKINSEDSHGTTALTFAASSAQQNTKVYDVLSAHGVNLKTSVNGDGANVLLLAIASDKDLALTNYFVSKGLDLNSTDAAGNNAFGYAAKSGNIELLKTLIAKGVKPNQYAILMAAQGGGGRRGGTTIGLPMFQYLESLNIKPTTTTKTGENVLHFIVRKQNQGEIITYFLGKGVDVNQTDEEGNTVLMAAASSTRDTATLGLLLPRTKKINQANLKGLTALTLAVKGQSIDVIRYLINKGADAKVLDKAGNNLAYYVVDAYRAQAGGGQGFGGPQGGGQPGGGQGGGRQNGQGGGQNPGGMGMGGGDRQFGPKPEDFDTKLTILKDAGLDITAPQKNGNTLYHLAVAKNDISLLKRLQPLNIDINAKNKEGMTALHKAALIAKDDNMMKYLLSIGAKKDAVTNFKETAYDLASENETLKKSNTSVNFLK